jgi:hypothetical protein
MAAGHELIFELMIDSAVQPMLTGLWIIFVRVNIQIVDHRGKGSRIEAHSWRVLIQSYLVIFLTTIILFYTR